jgi:hypothetical protein
MGGYDEIWSIIWNKLFPAATLIFHKNLYFSATRMSFETHSYSKVAMNFFKTKNLRNMVIREQRFRNGFNPLTHKTPFGDANVALIMGKVKVIVTSLFVSP